MSWTYLVSCEHAGNAVPDGLDLGVADAVLESHVAYDRGASGVAQALAPLLGAPLHLGMFTRLVVDLNRRAENHAVILEESYGVLIPGNVLTEAGRAERIARWHKPYRDALARDAARLASTRCAHLAIHSFDAALDPMKRDFDVGVLFDPARHPEAELATRLVGSLTREGLSARPNEPYLGTPEGVPSWLRSSLPPERYVGLEIECNDRWRRAPLELAAHLCRAIRDAV